MKNTGKKYIKQWHEDTMQKNLLALYYLDGVPMEGSATHLGQREAGWMLNTAHVKVKRYAAGNEHFHQRQK